MLRYFYDPESGIVDISLRCRVYRTQVKSNAEEGTVAISTLIVDDPAGDITFDPFRQIYITETESPSGEQVVYRGYIVDREVRRGPYRTGAGREWVLSLSDPNWLIGLRIVVGSDANRPAETDLERVQWLLTTTEANTFNGDDTYVNTGATTVDMDAADYRGQNVTSILDDCAQATGKNWWVVYFEGIGQYGLWYDFAWEPVYDSPLQLSNDLADVDNSTVFAISQENTTLERSPSRLVSGVYLPYDGGYVYVQDPVVGSNTIFRDAAAPSVNVKTSAKATARANRYLADNATEEDIIRTEVILPAAQVNDIMHGMRVPLRATHLPGYEDTSWMRALNRTVTETSEEYLTVGLELSPLAPAVEPFFILYRPQTVDPPLNTTVPIGWICCGNADGISGCPGMSGTYPLQPTVGPLFGTIGALSPSPPGPTNYLGITFTGTGWVSIESAYTAFGAFGGLVCTVEILLNGLVVATGFGVTPTVTFSVDIAHLDVVPGDILTAQYHTNAPGATGPYIDGVDQVLRVTGGSLFS